MKKEQLKELQTLHKAKNAFIDCSKVTQIGKEIYCIHISIEDWHRIFKTDDCTEQGLTFKQR